MKKNLKIMACVMAVSLLSSSCVGSFCMFNKLASWNKRATKSKFLNELLYIVISPAYVVSMVADVLVLNTIEFWTDDNPLASNVGKTQEIMGSDGRLYAVKTLKNGYEITNSEGEKMTLTYNKKTKTWMESDNGMTRELFRFNPDGTIQAFLPNGEDVKVTQDEAGLYELRMAVYGVTSWAMR
ncbi:MAG: DUF3332 domain-containing protein [Prevotella sp.]